MLLLNPSSDCSCDTYVGFKNTHQQVTDRRKQHLTLVEMAYCGEAEVLLTFGGQGQPFLKDLEELYHTNLEARALIESCAAALTQEDTSPIEGALILQNIDLISWLRDPGSRPAEEVLISAPVSYPLIFVAQAARLASLESVGLPPQDIGRWAAATTGHSQGIIAAWLAAQGLPQKELRENAARLTVFMHFVGLRKQASWRPTNDVSPTMAEIKGLTTKGIEQIIDGLNGMVCQIHNGPRRHVVAGPPEQLESLIERLDDRSGCREQHKPRVSLTPLPCSAPFHSPFMAQAVEPLREDAKRLEISLSPENVIVPILRYEDGLIWEGDPCLISSLCLGELDWTATLGAAHRLGVTHVIDLGPDDGMARITASLLEGHGIPVIAATTEAGRAILRNRKSEDVATPEPWQAHAPHQIRRRDGEISSINAFSSQTGRPPVLLLNSDEKDAQNQRALKERVPSERELCHRIGKLLDPSFGHVFDAGCVDPGRLDLSTSGIRMTRAAHKDGNSISGVAINVGSRPIDDTIALLKVLEGYQLKLCVLTVNDEVHMARALTIADAVPNMNITLHVGSDRPRENLQVDEIADLLFTWYARIRRRRNVLLMVRSDIGTPPAVQDLLMGSWSATQGYPPMPVDSVSIDMAQTLIAPVLQVEFGSNSMAAPATRF